MVPVLVTDDGEVIQDSRKIVEWAQANPASGAERAASPAS
jgi:glutathione S-transferase